MSLVRIGRQLPEKTKQRWYKIHKRRLEYALYQYSLGLITAGSVVQELEMLKHIENRKDDENDIPK